MCEKNEFGFGQAGQGLARGGEFRFVSENTKSNSIQYTPLLVQMMIELHVSPEKRSYYLYGSLPNPQLEVIELLKRARIITPEQTPLLPGAVQMWQVDEGALRVYVDKLCHIPLPFYQWVMPS